MKLANRILALCFFTASFDLILTINLGGTLRLTQILMVLFLVIAQARMGQKVQLLWPRSATSLMIWVLCLTSFIPQSGSGLVGLEMQALLLFCVVSFFGIVQVYGRSTQIEVAMKLYMASFAAIAVAGLIQFALPLVGLPSFLVSQWIIHGKLARINGFNLEPSYYATYLLLGWIMLVDLRISKARIASGRFWGAVTVLMTLAMFLSTSKSAWALMAVELLARFWTYVRRGLRNARRQARTGRLVVPLPRSNILAKYVAVLVLLIAVSIPALTWLTARVNLTVFLNGTGIANTPAHSVIARVGSMKLTWSTFIEHPFIGRSLGGVPVANGETGGVHVTNMDVARNFWGFPVLLDVLAASGVFAFIPFLVFLYANTIGAFRLATRYLPDERAKWLRALARAMIFEWIILLLDQNLLRVYLWYHFAMVATVAYHLVNVPVLEPLPVTTRFSWRLLRTVPYA